MRDAPEEFSRQNASSGSSYFRNKHILFTMFTSRLQKISHFEFYILRASIMEKSSKNEKSLWIKSRKKPGPKKKGKIESEDRKRDLAESDKGFWLDQETLVDVEGSVESDHEELEQRPSNLATVIGSSTQR